MLRQFHQARTTPYRRGILFILAIVAVWFVVAACKLFAEDLVATTVKPPVTASAKKPAATASKPDSTTDKRVQDLIHQLGSPRFTVRREAANELRQIGAEAFDALHTATENADPEVAASANYLLRQIAVRWVYPDDPANVKTLLRQYGQQADAARARTVEELAKLPQNAGVVALCRIARFDRSPLISRAAALAIIEPTGTSKPRPPMDTAVVEQQLGGSCRAAVVWLRQFIAQQRDPAAAIAAWKQVIDQEASRLEKSSDTSKKVVCGLVWNLAELYRQVGDQAALIAALERMMDLNGDGPDESIVQLLSWLTVNKQWGAVDAFLAKHESRIAQGKRPLYYAALARSEQGRKDLAEKLAAQAVGVDSQGRLEGFIAARELESRNQFEWAVREYRAAIDKQPAESGEPFLARISLANLLHDHEQDKEAADVLEQLVKSVQGDGRTGQFYAKLREYYTDSLNLPEVDGIAGRYHFYRGCQYQAEKDFTRARDEFDTALRFRPKDEDIADLLIAMYNLPEGSDAWRASVRQQLRRLTDKFQQEIDQNPLEPTAYNQWAWLVSNTEGDFQKAIRYSKRSLELNDNGDSGAASYLDTLGRCYYAAGDYENAVQCERQALEKVNYMQVMRRQLALFEKALAEKKAGGKEQRAGSK